MTWAIMRKKIAKRQQTTSEFVVLPGRQVLRQNIGLLTVDAAVAIYFAIIAPDVPGFLYVLIIVTIVTLHNIILTLAGLFERYEIQGDKFYHNRFFGGGRDFNFNDVSYIDLRTRYVILHSNYEKLVKINLATMDDGGIALLLARLDGLNITIDDNRGFVNNRGMDMIQLPMIILHCAIFLYVIFSLSLFRITDESFLYGAYAPLDALYGYHNWFSTMASNVLNGLTIMYIVNLLMVLILRLVGRFSNVFTLQSALSFFAVIMLFFTETHDISFQLDRLSADVYAVENDQLESHLLYFSLQWERQTPWIPYPGETAALHSWSLRHFDDNEGITLLFAHSINPASIREYADDPRFQIPGHARTMRLVKVTYTPELRIVLDIVPLAHSELKD